MVGTAVAIAVLLAVVPLAIGASPQLSAIFIGAGLVTLISPAFLLLLSRNQSRKAAHQEWVFLNGLKGTAEVRKSRSGNVRVNGMPILTMELALSVPGLPNRTVKHRQLVSVFAARRFRAGMVLPVCVNPEEPDDFVLVW
jgi:hypothetical protein